MVDTKVHVRRAYEDPAQSDGTRVLVDRIWPRGLTKARACTAPKLVACCLTCRFVELFMRPCSTG